MIILYALIAALIGLKLPDVDLAPVFFLRHRSAWTHGPFPAMLIAFLDMRFPAFHLAWMAMLIGLTLHLLADCFPKKWQGAALINFAPLKRTLKPLPSFLVLIVSSWFSGYTLYTRF